MQGRTSEHVGIPASLVRIGALWHLANSGLDLICSKDVQLRTTCAWPASELPQNSHVLLSRFWRLAVPVPVRSLKVRNFRDSEGRDFLTPHNDLQVRNEARGSG